MSNREGPDALTAFADLLCARLGQTEPGPVPALHRRAAAWYVSNGWRAEASDQTMAAGAFEEAASLVGQIAPATLWARGEIELGGWQGGTAVGPDRRVTHDGCLAWGRRARGNAAGALDAISKAEEATDSSW